MTGRRYPANRRLAWERLQRGWSYEEVAERIRTGMGQHWRDRYRAEREHSAAVGNR